MEIPVLQLGRILLITIQTELHDQMAEDLQKAVLEHLEDTSAEGVLMDITALEIVDSFISRVISETVKMAGLLGARMVLVGMQPAVTMTLIEMGIEMGGIETAMDMEAGLERLGYRLTRIRGPEVSAT